MNANHALCATAKWSEHMRNDVLDSLLDGLDLGTTMLEVGPGPGAATEWLRRRVLRLVAVEVDPEAAAQLKSRFADSNVEIHVGDATKLDFGDASFDSVGTFTMLHHLPTFAQQNDVFREALRVLRPGGVLVGSDSLHSVRLHEFHEGDVYNPIEPSSLLVRLQTVGFTDVMVRVGDELRFSAHKPAEEGEPCQ